MAENRWIPWTPMTDEEQAEFRTFRMIPTPRPMTAQEWMEFDVIDAMGGPPPVLFPRVRSPDIHPRKDSSSGYRC